MNKVVIFDWGGVILKEYPEHYCDQDAIKATIKKFNPNLSDDEAYQVYLTSNRDENMQIISALNDEESKYRWYKKIKENPTEIFPEYNEIKLIEEDQIIVKDFEEENSILTVPKLDKMNETYPPTSDINGNYIYKKNPIIMGGKYEGRYKLLTIGVPVSNQIDTIERCMKGIMPILQTISSELIVVDTGSTDGTVEITKKYGAKVIQFPWCDNMSAARNQAVYAAEGLWYMSIDDDEWFEDVTGILDFFQSGEYKNYNAAAYLQRNYMYENDIEYNEKCAVMHDL